jgi:flagellar biosynthesis chaperone FliJ
MVAHDPVDILRRLRRAAKDEAKRAYAACLAEEEAARRRAAEAEARMLRERQIAADPAQGDGAVEAYIAWLPAGRRETQAAQAAYNQAAANVTLARARLTIAHAAAEAATQFLEQRDAAANDSAARRSQTTLDEIAARPVPD